MAKVTAPLLGFGASGQIGKTQVYATWRGVPYARRHVIPANPQSAGQMLTRNTFGWLTQVWKLASADFIAPWNAYAQGKPLAGRNAFIGQNVKALRSEVLISDMIASPGAKGGLPAASAAATPGAGTLSIAVGAPVLPTGWTIVKAVAVVIAQQDPQTDAQYNMVTESDDTSPFAPAFTGLSAGIHYWAVWFVYQKGDGTLVYGPSTAGLSTTT